MKALGFPTLACVLSGLLFFGCTSPYEIKKLAEETNSYSRQMATAHQNDLRALKANEEARIRQLRSLVEEHNRIQTQVLAMAKEALENAKRSAIAELDREFDRQAQHIIAEWFWAEYRSVVNETLGEKAVFGHEKAIALKINAETFAKDNQAQNDALVAARKRYLDAAVGYETVESCFARLVLQIEKARVEVHNKNVKLFAATEKLSFSAAEPVDIPSGAKQIDERIAQLQEFYRDLDAAQKQMITYLNTRFPTKELLVSFASALVGIKIPEAAIASQSGISPSSATTIASISALSAQLTDVFAKISEAKANGSQNISESIEKLLANPRDLIRQLASATVQEPKT